jgi:hypothetical protein
MDRKEKFNLGESLWKLFNVESKLSLSDQQEILANILKETGLTFDELEAVTQAAPSQTIGNLKYRILAIMDKAKKDSFHII